MQRLLSAKITRIQTRISASKQNWRDKHMKKKAEENSWGLDTLYVSYRYRPTDKGRANERYSVITWTINGEVEGNTCIKPREKSKWLQVQYRESECRINCGCISKVMLGWAAEEFNWASKSGLRHLQMDISGAWIKVKWLYVQYTDGNADGRIFTWWNGRAEEDCIFKRLDRCLAKSEFQQTFPGLEVQHLPKIGSDHSPMQLKCDIENPSVQKSFRFLNFWVEHATFKEVVQENWKVDFCANPYTIFNHKLKKLKKALSVWSKKTYGDTFQKIASMAEVVIVHEAEFEANPTRVNRQRLQKVQAELTRFLALEENYWKQKAGMSWFKDGDRNTKFFHAQVRGRRKKLQLSRIQNSQGVWIDDETDIATEAIQLFQDQFSETTVPTDGLNGDSAGGPDGFTGKFYQSCWDIIGGDLYDMVRAFFNGHDLPKCVTHTNLVLLPKKKESGFVKGRSILENIILTQEIVTDMRLRTKAGPNVIIKLGMTKVYHRLSWLFLTKVLRKMGFSERFIGMVFGIVSNNCFRGVGKQAKSAVYLHHLTDAEVADKVEQVTGIKRQEFPIIYLGCPIFYSRRKMEYYQPMITKVLDRLQSWKGKMLSIGGRAVLIAHVLQSMPIHLLSAVNPPAYVINRLHKIFAQFFWSSSVTGSNRHWASWSTLCMPQDKGGIGFRSLHDVATALFCKLWWNYRTKPSLWSSFMSQKYCKKLNSVIVPWREGSHVWRKMLECRDLIEHQIIWHPRMVSSLFWYDNWTGLGALYFLVPQEFGIDESVHNVWDVVEGDVWNAERLYEVLPEEYAEHILQNIMPPTAHGVLDVSNWMLEPKGYFSVKTAWDYLRRRTEPMTAYKMIWVKGLPFKISFLCGRCEEISCHWMIFSEEPREENTQHLFFTSYAAKKVWRYFLGHAGISTEGLTLHQAIVKCWTADAIPRLKPIMQALPSIIVWELWKRRNSYRYGEAVTINRVVYQISTTLQSLIRIRKLAIQHVSNRWPDMIKLMEQYTPNLKFTKVMWEFPELGWIKVNTDGAARGNPGRSSIGFVVRDEQGDVLYAYGKEISEGTNTTAEAKAIYEALKYCIQHGYVLIDIHTDSMLLKNVIIGEWKPPWILGTVIDEIRDLMRRANVRIAHTLIEGNKLVDYIANYALDVGELECQGILIVQENAQKKWAGWSRTT
ncbi:PREDICTED: uncharacterized protein LOC109235804 [Nicotiana attenuata]|uniref:uncharacterized protein LOC109235804 n=1 Tax=Nicotiana attenuata TaxID=49451 RepID=UPI000905ADD6|nr:PREDICTED: uncharacterized protein LOC109235804 [Nicotiana attenuata]